MSANIQLCYAWYVIIIPEIRYKLLTETFFMSTELKGLTHTAIRLPYQYSLPKADFLEYAPEGYLAKENIVLPFAPIPTPCYVNGHISYTKGDFGIWFGWFVKSFEEYLKVPDNPEPGLLMTRDSNNQHYIQIDPIAGDKEFLRLSKTLIPSEHTGVIGIHAHPISARINESFAYPTPTDISSACFDAWNTNLIIDTEGITVVERGPEFYSELLRYLSSQSIPLNKLDYSVIWRFIDQQTQSIRENYDTSLNTTSNRRLIAHFTANVFGLNMYRLTQPNGSRNFDKEEINIPKKVKKSDINAIQELKKVLSSITEQA